MRRVLVTRPEPGASATAGKLRVLGYEPVLLPLSKTVSREPNELPKAGDFDAVAVTSANALRHAPSQLVDRYAGLPCLTVGARTAGMAEDAGFAAVKSADGNAEALAAMIERSLPAQSRILYFCGESRRPALETVLAAAGFLVTALETYRTDPINYSHEELARAMGGQPIEAILLYSPHAAARMTRLLADQKTGAERDARFLCMSRQIADTLGPGFQERVELAATPDEKALLALLGHAN